MSARVLKLYHFACMLTALFSFSEYGTSEVFAKTFNILVPEYKFYCLKVGYALRLLSEIVRNINESVCDTQIILIHV